MKLHTALVSAAFACALISSPAPLSADDSHSKRQHNVVRIDAMNVVPRVLTVDKEEIIVWVNYSEKTIQLAFPGDMKEKFTCPIRPRFFESGDGQLLSQPIRSLEFAMPCRIKPGEYDYSVLGLSAPGPIDPNPQSVVGFSAKGKIIVK